MNPVPKLTKVFVLDKLFTEGIVEATAEIQDNERAVVKTLYSGHVSYPYGKWFYDRKCAVATAERLRIKEIDKLNRRIEKLKALNFE